MEDLYRKDIKVVFGLEAQGHIPTIQAELKRWNDSYKKDYPNEPLDMSYSKHVWDGIGKLIGWCPFTAALYYFEWLSEQKTNTFLEYETQNELIKTFFVMQKDKISFGRLYIYNDDTTTMYISDLSVQESWRCIGYGKQMLNHLENIARKLNGKTICLQVNINTWMYDWYKRSGYTVMESNDNSNQNVLVWMEKILSKN